MVGPDAAFQKPLAIYSTTLSNATMRASYGLFVAINISFGFGLSSGNISNGELLYIDLPNF